MELSSEIIFENPQVAVLNVTGRVDGSNYLAFVEKDRELFVAPQNIMDSLEMAGIDSLYAITLARQDMLAALNATEH